MFLRKNAVNEANKLERENKKREAKKEKKRGKIAYLRVQKQIKDDDDKENEDLDKELRELE
jgi:hypothetical protein